MNITVIEEKNYRENMETKVGPYLAGCHEELWIKRDSVHTIHCDRYQAESSKGVMVISHGFTETAAKFREMIWYFLQAGYDVYVPEHCGHGKSYRLCQDQSLVHIDYFERYIEDLLKVAEYAKTNKPMYLFGHSMGGGIAACAAARKPRLFEKVILTSPMIQPRTGDVPYFLTECIAYIECALGKGQKYVLGQKPYQGYEDYESSASTSKARFDYYQCIKEKEPLYQTSAASYGWLKQAMRLNSFLMHSAWRVPGPPMVVFRAPKDDLVSVSAIEKYVKKRNSVNPDSTRLMDIPGAKHEIYGSPDTVLEKYLTDIFAFLG